MTRRPVTEKEGKGEGEKSIGPWMKYGHANLIFVPKMNCTHCDVTTCRFVGGLSNKKAVILLSFIKFVSFCIGCN